MVDINLIGDDQTQFDPEDNEKSFRNGFESDANESERSAFMSDSSMEGSDYTNYTNRGGSKKMIYFLVGGSLILLTIVAYFLFSGNKDEDGAEYLDMQTAAEDTLADSSRTEQPLSEISTLPPALQEKILKSQMGIRTVSNIIMTVPEAVNFTMITYNDGKFLGEFLANSEAAIDNLSSDLKQKLYSSDMKVLSRNNRNIQGRSLRQALMNGNVDLAESSSGAGALREPRYLSTDEMKDQITVLCNQAGIKMRQFDAGKNKTDGSFRTVPITFRAVGSKSSILAFLQQIRDENMNLDFSKISLIANDVDLSDSSLTLVLNIELYHAI